MASQQGAPIVGAPTRLTLVHMTEKQTKLVQDLQANKIALDAALESRARLFADARRAGVEWVDICEAGGVARMTANRIAMDGNGGKLPKPGDRAPRRPSRKG